MRLWAGCCCAAVIVWSGSGQKTLMFREDLWFYTLVFTFGFASVRKTKSSGANVLCVAYLQSPPLLGPFHFSTLLGGAVTLSI